MMRRCSDESPDREPDDPARRARAPVYRHRDARMRPQPETFTSGSTQKSLLATSRSSSAAPTRPIVSALRAELHAGYSHVIGMPHAGSLN
jgi:hypothetical protein